jgi:hypothetical protein
MSESKASVRSALFKQDTGGLVVRWVTTSESPLLYVFVFAIMKSLFIGVGVQVGKNAGT